MAAKASVDLDDPEIIAAVEAESDLAAAVRAASESVGKLWKLWKRYDRKPDLSDVAMDLLTEGVDAIVLFP